VTAWSSPTAGLARVSVTVELEVATEDTVFGEPATVTVKADVAAVVDDNVSL
jgi:hypothetical protein